jgi:MoaA/NifB/PqqE/SkfB family radical SAM enzyme
MTNRNGKTGPGRARTLVRSAWNAARVNGEALFGIVPSPRSLTFFVTYECNLRCRTCGIWKHGAAGAEPELSLAEMADILADPLFARLEYFNINGGEPHLRPDLPEIAELVMERFPRLRTLSLNTNGVPAARSVSQVTAVADRCFRRRIPLAVSISLHVPGPAFDEIVGVPGAWCEVQSALEQLQRLQKLRGFYLSVNCVISALNAHRIEDMAAWSRERNIPANFVLAEVRERFHNREMENNVSLRQDQKPSVIRFFRRLAQDEPFLRHHRLRYRLLADMLESGGPRRLSCQYRIGGAVLGSRGELYYCKAGREIGNCRLRPPSRIYFAPEQLRYRKKELLSGVCPRCLPYTFNRQEVEKDCLKYLLFLARAGRPN